MISAKEVARDLRALGSMPFYFIVVIRSMIGLATDHSYVLFLWQLLVGAACLLIVDGLTNKKESRVDMRIAAAFVLAVFTCYFYRDVLFSVFAFILLGMVIAASAALKIKRNAIFGGIAVGALSSVAAFYVAPFIAGL